MNIKTLFSAYKKSEMNKSYASKSRKNGDYAIAVSSDGQAKEWQRYDRLSRRIDARINGDEVCPLCAASKGNHYSYCKNL